MKTKSAKKEEVKREWLVLDAAGIPLGRLASTIAFILRGKHKPIYTPHVDTGDHVIVINAGKIKITGRKLEQKRYIWHTQFPGGFRSRTMLEKMQTKPEWVIKEAVKGMLPHNILGRQMLSKLKVYGSDEHPHEAQKPRPITFNEKRIYITAPGQALS